MSEVVEEEAEVPATIVSSQSSLDGDIASVEPNGWEESLQALSLSLELPVETLQAIGGSEDGKLLLQKVVQHNTAKESELEEYENTVKDLTQTLSSQQQEGIPRWCALYRTHNYYTVLNQHQLKNQQASRLVSLADVSTYTQK